MRTPVTTALFHLVAFTIATYSTLYDYVNIEVGRVGLGGKLKFLTKWNICFQILYFGMSLLKDSLDEKQAAPGLKFKRSTLHIWMDRFHACIAFPFTMFVFTSFWVLYGIDRELVFPESLDKFIPGWVNHSMHTTILPFMLIEQCVIYHQYPRRRAGLAGTLGVAVVYLAWILFIAYYDDFWVYPVLRVLSAPHRAGFIAACLLGFVACYILGEKINHFVWRKEIKAAEMIQTTKAA